MTKELFVSSTPHETRVGMVEDDQLAEIYLERENEYTLAGSIYKGRVTRVLPGMQSAFIQIGLDRAAFLHVADIWSQRQTHEESKPIERILHDGQRLLVQVIKDPIGTKGARLSTQISIAGRLLVYLPQESHIGISQRIEDENERALLREKLQHLVPPEERGGYIAIIDALKQTKTTDVGLVQRIVIRIVAGHDSTGDFAVLARKE